jgi:aryl-alcohol dehydrogenase-like predicted oxidoreductase
MDGLSDIEKMSVMIANDGIMVNRIGLSRKHIFDAVDASVERLGTYMDVLQIHRLDRDTPREEIMKALNDVVESGKVRYLGASSVSGITYYSLFSSSFLSVRVPLLTPALFSEQMHAWEFQALNNIASENGWHKFISMQDYYSLLYREEEREMHPYCRDAGIGIIPWSPLSRGLLTRPYQATQEQPTVRQGTDFTAEWLMGGTTEADIAIINRVEELAQEKGCSMAQIGIVWCLVKGVNPIVGLSSSKRLDEAVQAVALFESGVLTEADVKSLDDLYVPKMALSGTW